ncbi:terpene synthase family protein [Aspergillus aculeatinus CBS 121060]|uniref:Terpenoid synthase n=1 Tax=Aspergillus aculeatinus CBS 121060 TaxID=1448322 RepID=A0ACD1H8L4_9EURO|nr:terpenoid synthase [Aspergillus aculeatinus CBS 121060]RAH69857.1 terpenoid synthase [Aspergillus aculeatinus CBS 121060]
MLAGYFWSGSDVERFLPLAKFMYWFFLWDDEIDCGRLANDAKGTQAYRESTLAFLKRTLEPDMPEPGPSYDAADHNSGCFEEISPALRSGTTVESRRRFADSLYDYVDSVCAVQETREERLPGLGCYFANRELSIGAYPCIMAMEFAYDVRVPHWIYEDSHMRTMFRETAISCIVLGPLIPRSALTRPQLTGISVNDIISLRKELIAGQFDSVIPLKMLHDPSLSAQDAMNEACQDLVRSKRVFQEAESSLSDSDAFRQLSAATKAEVRTLLTGCKNMMVGNVKWSLANDRYLSRKDSQDRAVRLHL